MKTGLDHSPDFFMFVIVVYILGTFCLCVVSVGS